MKLSTIELTMNGLHDISNAGARQSKRVKDILKLMLVSIKEHDMMMSVPEYVNNYIAFVGQEGLDTAIQTRDTFAEGIQIFVDSGLISEDEVNNLGNS